MSGHYGQKLKNMHIAAMPFPAFLKIFPILPSTYQPGAPEIKAIKPGKEYVV
jgi:hypothetical protein